MTLRMVPFPYSKLSLVVPIGPVRLAFGPIWIAVLPLMTIGAKAIYVPLVGSSLGTTGAWLAGAAIVGLFVIGLALHALAHAVVALLTQSNVPHSLPVHPLGDASQVWGNARAPGYEALSAMAGPIASLACSAIAYGVWDLQLGTFVNTVTFFLIFAYLGVGILNLAPGYPFDGGRLLHTMLSSGIEARGRRIPTLVGITLLLGMAGWAGFLYFQRLRFSSQTALATVIIAALAAVALAAHRTSSDGGVTPRSKVALRPLKATVIGLVALAMAGGAAMLLPTNNGMIAPGFVASVEPMVHVPADRSYSVKGTLVLTTVIPQAPIVLGQWLNAHYDNAILLTSQENIVPQNQSPQQVAIQSFHDLQQSEKTAIVVGLRLAGYDASLTYTGAEVLQIANDSHANGMLHLGDTITSIDGQAINVPDDPARILGQDPQATTAQIDVARGGQQLSYTIPLLPPASGSSTPRIGIAIGPTGDHLDLPFNVTITPEKVDGGPSAGLMFTLTVYNLLTPHDITGGHKIAGTGTIDLNGNVGPIGGVQQKVAAAERFGAEYFLCPPDNYADALSVAKHIKVVRIATAQQALDFLGTLTPVG